MDFQTLYEEEKRFRENLELEKEDLMLKIQKFEWDGEIKQDSKDYLLKEIEDLKTQLKSQKLVEIQNYDKSMDRMDISEVKREYRKQSSRLTFLEREMDSKQKEHERLSLKSRELEKKNVKLTTDLAESEKEKARLDRELKESKLRYSKLEQSIEKAKLSQKQDESKFTKLKESKDDFEKKYLELKKQKEVHKAKLEELEPLYQSLVANHNLCVTQNENLTLEKKELEDTLTRRCGELEEERMMVENMNHKLKHLSSLIQQENREKQKEMEVRSELENEVNKNRQVISKWSESCEYIKSQCQTLTQQLNVLDHSLVEMHSVKNGLEEEKKHLLFEITDLKHQLESSALNCGQWKEKAEQGQIYLNQLNSTKEALNGKNMIVQSLGAKVSDLESQREYNLNKIRLLEQNVQQVSQMLQLKETQMNQVEKECFSTKQIVMQQECTIKEMQLTVAQYNVKMNDLTDENHKLETKLKDCIAQLGTLLIEVQESRDKQGILVCKNEEFNRILEEKNSTLLQMELKLEKTKTKLRTTEQTILNLSKEKDQLLWEVDDLRLARELLDACKKRNEKLSSEVAHLMRLLDDKTMPEKDDQIKKYQQELIEMENKIKSLEEERDEYLAENPFEKIEELTRQLNKKVKPILKFKTVEEPL